MIPLSDQVELRKITISCLLSCVYLPIIVTGISYSGQLYSVGKASSFYILVLIFVAEFLKAIYLNCDNDLQSRRNRQNKTNAVEVFKSVVFLLGVLFCFFIGIILFGAPIRESHEETLMLSTLLTLLAAFPLIAHCGIDLSMQYIFRIRHFRLNSIEEMLLTNAFMTLTGSWVGAIVIPLDWRAPWQKWPVPAYLGALGGYILGNVIVGLKVNIVHGNLSNPVVNLLVTIFSKLYEER